MSRHNFQVREHILPCSHVRTFPHATQNEEEDVLQMHIKCYTPLSNARWEPYDVTFIAAHANGIGKELYETLWDELLAYSRKSKKFRIRSIWIADIAHQGQSGVLNEGKLGNDPSWDDHPRDLLMMINHFRKAMPQPLVGIGHSLGGQNITNLALMHPRLFASVILLDPVIMKWPGPQGKFNPAYASTFRRDLWPSRQIAREAFLRSAFYQSWDPRVFDLWIEYGLRDLPTELYPEGTIVPPERKRPDTSATTPVAASRAPVTTAAVAQSGTPQGAQPVTLTTTKHHEVFTFLRGQHPKANEPLSSFGATRITRPDLSALVPVDGPFYQAGPKITYHQLPHLRPSCLYLLGATSDLVPQADLLPRLAITGTGIGGSGGANEDQVRQVFVADGGHFFPFEKPGETARQAGLWLDERIPSFRQERERGQAEWAKVKRSEKSQIGEDRMWWTKHEIEALKAQAERERESDSPAASLPLRSQDAIKNKL